MSTRGTLTAIALIGALATFAAADTLSVQLAAVATISGPAGGDQVSRALAGIEIPIQLNGAQVDAAFLVLPAPALAGPGEPLVIRCHRLARPWQDDGVSWTEPWQQPGGDFDSTALATAVTWPEDESPLRFDITGPVRDWLDGAGCYGVILLRPEAEGGGFGPEAQAVADALGQASVKFYYTRPAE